MSQRDIKTVNTVADAYRSMYAKPIEINEDILNEELIDSLIEEVRSEETELTEAMSKQMSVQQYANKVGIDAKEKQWIIDNDADIIVYADNSKLKNWSALGYPIRTGDYYFAFLCGDTEKERTAASRANMMMNNYLKSEYAKAKKLKFDGEAYDAYMIASHLWNFMSKEFDKLPSNLGAGDTMTREELYKAIEDITSVAPTFESYDYEEKTIEEGMLSGIVGKIVNKIRSARKKVGKKIKLGKKAKIQLKAGSQLKASSYTEELKESKTSASITRSVADAYAQMQQPETIDEVKRPEVEAMKKVSKDMQKVLVSYQKIANMGDKELKNTVHNKDYKKVLDARDTILKMIGTLNTKLSIQEETITEGKNLMPGIEKIVSDKQAQKVGGVMIDMFTASVLTQAYAKVNDANKKKMETSNIQTLVKLAQRVMGMKEEFELVEASAGEMIDKLFNLKGNKDAGYGVAKMLSMTGVKVIQAMQKQNPQGFMKTVIALGKEKGKMQIPTNNALMKMFKQQGIKPLPEAVSEKVKDGKLDPLSKMGKMKLTGTEIQKYYRDNPKQKAAARDKTVKKAIELALDLDGNMNYAMKEIEKIKRGLSKLPAVKLALRHANESKEWTGHHVVIEALSSTDMIKLKTYGKMLGKLASPALKFDENNPEKGIDKIMGQIWKQKHHPSNWERLHKMVAMLKGIGVSMPSLKGKYMGLDPVTKKAIFYKEGTDTIINWYDKIDEIKEEIEELIEKVECPVADVKKMGTMTDRNDHNGSLMVLAKCLKDKKSMDALKGITQTHKAMGHMPQGLIDVRKGVYDNLMKQAKTKFSNYNDIYSAF